MTPRTHQALGALAPFALLLAANAFALRSQTPAPPPPTAETPTPVVALSVIVTDEKGLYADDVRREEFRVFEDGREGKVDFVEKETSPLSYGLVVDNSASARTLIDALIATAQGFVTNNRDGDETFIVRFVGADKIYMTQDFTSDKAALRKALEDMYIEGGPTALIDAVHLAAEHVSKRGAGERVRRRRALILLTDGEDRASYHTLDQLLKRLRETDVQIFAVGFVGVLSDERGFIHSSKRERATALLKRLAEETGGRAYFPRKLPELGDAFAEIMRHLRTRFVVGYVPPAARGGKGFRKVEVRISDAPNRGKRVAVTRPGYVPAAAAPK